VLCRCVAPKPLSHVRRRPLPRRLGCDHRLPYASSHVNWRRRRAADSRRRCSFRGRARASKPGCGRGWLPAAGADSAAAVPDAGTVGCSARHQPRPADRRAKGTSASRPRQEAATAGSTRATQTVACRRLTALCCPPARLWRIDAALHRLVACSIVIRQAAPGLETGLPLQAEHEVSPTGPVPVLRRRLSSRNHEQGDVRVVLAEHLCKIEGL